MHDHFILSPFFLDQERPGLSPLRESGWMQIKPAFSDADRQDRMAAIHQRVAAEVEQAVLGSLRPVVLAGGICA